MWQFYHKIRYCKLKFKAPIIDDGEKWEKEMKLFKHWPLMLPISFSFDAYTLTMMWQGDCKASYRIGLSKMSYITNLNPIESCLQRGGQIGLNLTQCKWFLRDTQHLWWLRILFWRKEFQKKTTNNKIIFTNFVFFRINIYSLYMLVL